MEVTEKMLLSELSLKQDIHFFLTRVTSIIIRKIVEILKNFRWRLEKILLSDLILNPDIRFLLTRVTSIVGIRKFTETYHNSSARISCTL